MASNARNPNHGAAFPALRPLRDRLMRAGYVLVTEERESDSEYSGSTCCCSSCASSCSCEEYTDDSDGEEEEEDDDDGDSDDDEIVIEEAEVVEEEEEGYWSDCSACWTRRRERERRSRMGRRFGNRYMNDERAVEGSDVVVHHHPFQREHRGRNETSQRQRRNANVTFRNTNSIINGSNDNNAHSTAAETPSFRGLVDRIVSTTRQLRQGEQPVRHLRSWARVLEDLQRGVNAAAAAGAVSNTTANPTAAGRAANVDDENGAREAEAENQERPRRATSYFMSGGRSTSNNRRRRLR